MKSREIVIHNMLQRDFHHLVNCYVSDYFAKELWTLIKEPWWSFIARCEPPELAMLLNTKTWTAKKVWPLSLMAFRIAIHSVSLDRNPVQTSELTTEINASNRHEITDGQLQNLEHCYRRSVKPKKQHEINELGQVVSGLCEEAGCDNVIDVGAGQGHLARILAYRFLLVRTSFMFIECFLGVGTNKNAKCIRHGANNCAGNCKKIII